MPDLVRYESSDRVVTVTLDSPANRNALSRVLVAQLRAALDAAGLDETAHAVLLTHTGPAFCSGADLSEMRSGHGSGLGPGSGTADMLSLFRQVLTLPIPVVARVDGAVRAGGLGVLGACDVVLASARSTFAFTEVRLGLAPAVISLPLRSLLTARGISRYFLTGETFAADVAAEIGLITAVGDDVAPVLDGLRRADRQGLRETRPLTTRDRLAALDSDGTAMGDLSARLFASPVARAHFDAFLNRGEPSPRTPAVNRGEPSPRTPAANRGEPSPRAPAANRKG
ncbi:MAG TPA: enoyl-CoA hydratase-related protein [Streptosporangiaceae bacterium]|nr:enoyl-CoA hydratase-related protein [Streptosporangiaceae bacterium]